MANKHHLRMLTVALALCAGALTAQPVSSAEGSQLQATYDVAVKCYIANAHARGQRQRAGDAAKANYYSSKAAQAYDAAHVVGAALGLSRTRMTADFEAAKARQLPAMVRDQAYFYAAAADCKAAGLM